MRNEDFEYFVKPEKKKELAMLINDEKGNTIFSHVAELTEEKKAIFLTQLRYLLEMINEAT